MDRQNAIDTLRRLLEEEQRRVTRLWAKRIRDVLREPGLMRAEEREQLALMVHELARLLRERGEAATFLWPEAMRQHAVRRYRQYLGPDDLVRELHAFAEVVERRLRRRGEDTPEVGELVEELVVEAIAQGQDAYFRSARAEESIARDAETMQRVLQNLEIGVMLAQADGSISYATPPTERLLGVPIRALVGPKGARALAPVLSSLHARHRDGRPFRVQELPHLRTLADGRPLQRVEMVIDRAGAEVTLELRSTPLSNEEGERVGALLEVADRTEGARKNEALARTYEALRSLQGRLVERSRAQAVGQLAASASHALNNALNVLRLRITLLQREYKPEHVQALDRTVRNIGELVARLQEFSAPRGEEQVVASDLDALVRDALDLTHAELLDGNPPISLSTQLDAHARARVDESLFREVLVNLLLAARERMPMGGPLQIRSSVEGDKVRIELEDAGPQLPEEDVAQLFDPFKSRKAPAQLALVLGLARSQVRRWGGELTASVAPSGGLRFTLELPLAQRAAEKEELPAPRPRQRGPARRVLVVDDEVDNARMLGELLSDEGYDVELAFDGQQAVRAWANSHFDAALLDALLPDVSGFELARQFREQSPTALIAMLTGADVRGQSREALARVDAIFHKPLELQALDDFLSQEQAASGAPALH